VCVWDVSNVGEIHHEHGKIGAVVYRRWVDRHEIFQTPILFGISEIEFDGSTTSSLPLPLGSCETGFQD
jgi:hypothetical protein